jgi:hypothetical protein
MLRRFSIAVAVVALFAFAAAPGANAGMGAADRPFRATMAGEASWDFTGDARPDCGPVATLTHATGTATHMGRASASMSHCPILPEYIGDGRLTLAAANGDELRGTYDYDPTDETNAMRVTVTGGSGRFEGASGSATMKYGVEPQVTTDCTTEPFCFDVGGGYYLDFTVPWMWSATLTGTISY